MDKKHEAERINRFQSLVANRIEQDILVPRRLVMLQGAEIDELNELLENYLEMIKNDL